MSKINFILSRVMLGIVVLIIVMGAMSIAQETAVATEDVKVFTAEKESARWAFISAGIAVGIGSIAAGFAVAKVGTAAMGTVAERPEVIGRCLLFIALAEGIAIYGLLVAILILAKV